MSRHRRGARKDSISCQLEVFLWGKVHYILLPNEHPISLQGRKHVAFMFNIERISCTHTHSSTLIPHDKYPSYIYIIGSMHRWSTGYFAHTHTRSCMSKMIPFPCTWHAILTRSFSLQLMNANKKN